MLLLHFFNRVFLRQTIYNNAGVFCRHPFIWAEECSNIWAGLAEQLRDGLQIHSTWVQIPKPAPLLFGEQVFNHNVWLR